MVTRVDAYADHRGKLHTTVEEATVSDLSALFGKAEGMSIGIARDVLKHRCDIEKIFAEQDAMMHPDFLAYLEKAQA